MKMDLKELMSKLVSNQSEVGSYAPINSVPWTAPCDAVIQARVYPATAATSYITFNIDDGRIFNLTAYGGTALSGEITVKKGAVISNYQQANLAAGASYIGYIPLKKS